MKEYKKPEILAFDMVLENVILVSQNEGFLDVENGGFDEIWE